MTTIIAQLVLCILGLSFEDRLRRHYAAIVERTHNVVQGLVLSLYDVAIELCGGLIVGGLWFSSVLTFPKSAPNVGQVGFVVAYYMAALLGLWYFLVRATRLGSMLRVLYRLHKYDPSTGKLVYDTGSWYIVRESASASGPSVDPRTLN